MTFALNGTLEDLDNRISFHSGQEIKNFIET